MTVHKTAEKNATLVNLCFQRNLKNRKRLFASRMCQILTIQQWKQVILQTMDDQYPYQNHRDCFQIVIDYIIPALFPPSRTTLVIRDIHGNHTFDRFLLVSSVGYCGKHDLVYRVKRLDDVITQIRWAHDRDDYRETVVKPSFHFTYPSKGPACLSISNSATLIISKKNIFTIFILSIHDCFDGFDSEWR